MRRREMTKTAVLAIISLAIMVLTGLSLYAQQNVGSIKGTVEDPSGGAIPEALGGCSW